MSNSKKLVELVRANIGSYPDFPQQGILFRDIFSVFKVPEALQSLRQLLIEHVKKTEAQVIVGLEARGFLLGPMIAVQLGLPFVPIRKKGKLPGEIIQQSFTLEYGADTFEVQSGSIQEGQTVLIVDDLLATGGSLVAACQLMEKIGARVVECLVVMELKDLHGREKVPVSVHSFIEY